ncbi:MAG: MFS transporter, partial [Micrococcales bacterium]|nr:MFS transporter [Micrococcales bacterium]
MDQPVGEAPANPQSRAQRLDNLRFTRLHGRLLGASGLGWAMDAMDVGLISFIMVTLPEAWNLDATSKSWIAAAGFAGMAIGASTGGWLADRIGRRQVFALTMIIFGLATGASALAWGLAILIALRFVVGLGLGAELPVASTLVSEFSPTRIRGRMIVWLEAFWAVGWTLAALIGHFVASPESVFGTAGWRIAFALGMLPAFYAVVIRRTVPESVRFLETKGRLVEAEAVVAKFEAAAGRGGPAPSDQNPGQPPAHQAESTSPAKVPVS